MLRLAVLLVVLAHGPVWGWVLPPPFTPCPGVFRYLVDEFGYSKGRLTVPPGSGLPVHVTLELILKGQLHSKNNKGRIVLADNEDVVHRRLLAGTDAHIIYNVHFPQPYPVPLIHRIIINNKIICEGPGDFYVTLMNGHMVTEFTLEHVLMPANSNHPLPTSTAANSSGRRKKATCGQMNSAVPLVSQGQDTSQGQWPWHTALYRSGSYICGGVLISPTTIVTVAHCVTKSAVPVEPSELLLSFGKYSLSMESEGEQDRKVAAIHVHPLFNSTTFYSDLAVLTLARPVDITQYVRPVCFMENTDANLRNIENTEGYVVGWGLDELGKTTDDLRLATMPVVSQEECLRSYPEFFGSFSNNMTFCAGYRNGTSPCNGDSGGGMVFPEMETDGSQVWFLRGLVSLSVSLITGTKRVCDPKHYIVFTDVTKYYDWLAQYVE